MLQRLEAIAESGVPKSMCPSGSQYLPYFSSRFVISLVAAVVALGAPLSADERPPGERIYQKQCASCHGAQGEGVAEEYPDALIGDRSLKELTRYIIENMPAEHPEQCVGKEAEEVARYVYDAFYSEIAQARNRPATIQFARLTVRQYENAVADLLKSFGGDENEEGDPGLEAEYYDSRRTRRDKRVIERIDPVVDFDFGDSSPHPEKIGVEEFSASWEGSVFAPDTGDYEFIVETENGARLWVNDQENELIDAWVKSGDQTVYRGSLRLLGGRRYPLKLEFFKFKEKSASIKLKWKPPHLAEQVIPRQFLSTAEPRSTFVITTPFPPDDRSTGYEVGSAVSKAWDEATTYAALEAAAYILPRLDRFAGTDDDAEDRAEKIRNFCGKFAERAFRHPLSEEDRKFFIEQQFQDGMAPDAAAKRAIILVLKSPRFLYREYGFGPFDSYDVASWLAFTCWDSIPDEQLFKAAAEDQLQSREQIARQVERMMADRRTRAKMREFLHQWLNIDQQHDMVKSSEVYPEFSEAVATDMRISLDLFLDEVIWSDDSDFRRLFLSSDVYVNGRLGEFFKYDLFGDAPFQKVSLEHEGRAGVLSHPFLMARFAYDAGTSPIHRGVYIARGLLGRRLKPPPVAVAPLAPDLHADLNTRERVMLQTSPDTCQTCHAMINPLGFSLEHFDAVGRYRPQEKDRPIDDSGWYLDRSGEKIEFEGASGLAEYLANSPETHEAFVEQLFQFFTKQPVRAFGDEQLPKLEESFAKNDYNVRRILAEVLTDSAHKIRGLAEKEARQTANSAARSAHQDSK